MNIDIVICILAFALASLFMGYLAGHDKGLEDLKNSKIQEEMEKINKAKLNADRDISNYFSSEKKAFDQMRTEKLNELQQKLDELQQKQKEFDINFEKNRKKKLDELQQKQKEFELAHQKEQYRFMTELYNIQRTKEDYEKKFIYIQESFSSFIARRKWLLEFINDAYSIRDQTDIDIQLSKSRPAVKMAEKLSQVQAERRELLLKYKELEYQIKTYEEYFPFLVEYKNEILNDEIKGESELANSEIDPVSKFLSSDEYINLSSSEKNQLALDRYIQKHLSKSEIGRMYERYIGSLYEKKGYDVEFIGIEKGLEDLGQDLICSKGNQVIVIQAKCWSESKVIRERHILQLYATSLLHELDNKNKKAKYSSILYTTTKLSDLARDVANKLGVEMKEEQPLPKDYPMIKCNIGKNGEKIYHLPFDQMYDKIKINLKSGEFYAKTVKEAERKGFRRAFRWKGNKN